MIQVKSSNPFHYGWVLYVLGFDEPVNDSVYRHGWVAASHSKVLPDARRQIRFHIDSGCITTEEYELCDQQS